MHLQDHVTTGWQIVSRILKAAARLDPCRLCVVVTLAFMIGSVGQALPVHAQNLWVYRVEVVNPKIVICTNQTVTYRVRVVAIGPASPGTAAEPEVVMLRPGITLAAKVSGSSVGAFVNAVATGLSPLPGSDLRVPDTVEFTFKAGNKTGKAQLTFGASDISYVAVSASLAVTVQPCRIQVIAISRWSASYASGSIKIMEAIYNGELKVDQDGGYTGKGDVVGLSTSVVPECFPINALATSTANMRGYLTEDDKLMVQLTYAPTTFKDSIPCPEVGTGGSIGEVKIFPLTFTVPTFGGAVKLSHQIEGGPGIVTGSGDFYALPVEDAK